MARCRVAHIRLGHGTNSSRHWGRCWPATYRATFKRTATSKLRLVCPHNGSVPTQGMFRQQATPTQQSMSHNNRQKSSIGCAAVCPYQQVAPHSSMPHNRHAPAQQCPTTGGKLLTAVCLINRLPYSAVAAPVICPADSSHQQQLPAVAWAEEINPSDDDFTVLTDLRESYCKSQTEFILFTDLLFI